MSVFQLTAQVLDSNSYFGINIVPISGSTIELYYEKNLKTFLILSLSLGYTINSKISSVLKVGEGNFIKKTGLFLKIEPKLIIRRNIQKPSLFLGMNINNSIIDEETDLIKNNSYILGICGIFGVNSGQILKRLSMDLGFQYGYKVIGKLIGSYHSYIPGMGVGHLGKARIQGILIIKYKIKS